MKRSLFTAGAALLLSGTLLAGGILTNTNQSAMYTRMGVRVATIGIDAVYYNPAGLTKLENGLHFSINNQTIGQTRTITSDYSYLNDGKYIGEVFAPLFPDVFAVFKVGKLAISAGFMPIGGGGGATYNTGLPSFEYAQSDLFPALVNMGQNVTGYRMDAFFEGSSIYFGYQANVSYALNDMISIAVGARYVTAKENYMGHLNDIEINLDGTWTSASTFFTGVAGQYTTAYDNAIAGSTGITTDGDPLTDLLSNPTAIAVLTGFGYPPAALAAMNNATALGTLGGIATSSATSAAKYTATSALLADQDVECEKTASGITPIFSVNIQPIDMLNIAIKYEHKTSLELVNATPAGKGGLVGFSPTGTPQYIFPDGEKAHLDLPAMLSVGATLQPMEALLVSAGMNYYMDKNADWNGREELLDANTWDIGIGGEFALGEKLVVSAGWSMTQVSPGPLYQTDLSYTLSTQGISAGFGFNIMDNIQLNVGGQYVIYGSGERTFKHDLANSGALIDVTETLEKSIWIVGVGLNVSLAR